MPPNFLISLDLMAYEMYTNVFSAMYELKFLV